MAAAAAAPQTLNARLRQLTAGATSSEGRRELLKFVRKSSLRESALVCSHGAAVLALGGLGDEEWTVREQVLIAALDTHDYEGARAQLARLTAQFPASQRVRRLEGMLHEARGEWMEARGVYEEILQVDPANAIAQKRCICTFKGENKLEAAVKGLNQYLETFSTDAGSWAELFRVYLSLLRFEDAEFCAEELILLQPHDYMHHLRYAELLYTMHAPERKHAKLELARQHFARSLELRLDGNTRALYGLAGACKAIRGTNHGKNKGKEENDKVYAWAVQNLTAIYEDACPEKVALITAAFS